MSHNDVLSDMQQWFESCLNCVAGRREFQLNRYMIEEVNGPADVCHAYDRFEHALRRREAVACLFVLSNAAGTGPGGPDPAIAQMRRIAEIMSVLCDRSPDDLLNGGNLNKQIELRCPVTNQDVVFDDFDAVAFCPSSEDESDPLYDPMMAAPYLCANLSSDIFAFSIFTRDMSLARHDCEIWDMPDNATRRAHFGFCAAMWQRFAMKTIKNFIKVTNVELCPTALADDGTHWYANHQDPAFAETRKDVYRHDMPVLYTQRIIEAWQRFYQDGEPVSLADATPPGVFEDDSLCPGWP